MIRVSKFACAVLAVGAVGLGACSTTIRPGKGSSAGASLVGGDGSAKGMVTMRDSASGVAVTVTVAGLPAGVHGLHLHEKGICDGPAFASAGGHWNPGMRKHGRDNPAGAHLGDLPNLQVAPSGKGAASLSVASAPETLADTDGTALVIHAKADDYATDPSGNSGERIACAVLAPPK